MTGDRAADLQTRQGELQRELSHARVRLEAIQGAVIENTGTSAELVQAQAAVTSLEGTLKVIAKRLEAAEAREAAQVAQERREALKGTMAQAAEQASEHFSAIPAGIAELAKIVEPELAKIAQHVQLHHEARERFRRAGIELHPALKHSGELPNIRTPTAAQIAADRELDMQLASLKAKGVNPAAALTPLFVFALKTSRDHHTPEFLASSKLNLAVWQLWLSWHRRQLGAESLRIYLKEP